MKEKGDFVYKERDTGNKELLSMLIYRPTARFILIKFLKNSKITPNQISIISLILFIIASFFFAFFRYPAILIGLIFMHLGYAFDMLDGIYARYKKLSSKFGQWLDPFLDTVKAAFLFISLSYRAYVTSGNPNALIWGSVAMANSLLSYYILNTRDQVVKSNNFEVKLGKNIYVGYEITLYWAITLPILFNKLYFGLVFLATVGALSWIKVFISLRRYYIKHKSMIENEP